MAKAMWTCNELMEYLKISRNTLAKWTRDGLIPYYKVGKSLRFDSEEIGFWLESKHHTPVDFQERFMAWLDKDHKRQSK